MIYFYLQLQFFTLSTGTEILTIAVVTETLTGTERLLRKTGIKTENVMLTTGMTMTRNGLKDTQLKHCCIVPIHF